MGSAVGAQPIGIFEVMFGKKAKYAFRIKDNLKQPTKRVDAYFIRRQNFKMIQEEFLDEKICDAIEEFKN